MCLCTCTGWLCWTCVACRWLHQRLISPSVLAVQCVLLCQHNFLIVVGSSISSLESAVHAFPSTSPSRCNDVSGFWAPCLCTLQMSIGWYPCGLKFCKGKSESTGNGNNASYRCGIKTCRKFHHFEFYVRQKQQCLWDDWPQLIDSSIVNASFVSFEWWQSTMCSLLLFALLFISPFESAFDFSRAGFFACIVFLFFFFRFLSNKSRAQIRHNFFDCCAIYFIFRIKSL